MNKIIRITFLIAFIMGLAACSSTAKNGSNTTPQTAPPITQENSNPPAVQPSSKDYFPSTPGSTWSYQGSGNEFASFTRQILFSSANQIQMKESNGGTVSTSIYEFSEGALKRVYFQGESYQPVNLLAKGFKSNESMVILKEPLQTGKEWSTSSGQRRIVQTDAQVNTPAGVFNNCIKVDISEKNSSALTYEYYAKGVGLVKREFIDGTMIISSTLENYQIK